jgi:hypothetical protein
VCGIFIGIEFEFLGGSSLVNISTIPSLLDVVSLTSLPDSLISFATRSVRIIDILTSLSYNEFNSHDGIQTVVKRLVFEVNKCREFVEQNAQSTERHFVCHHHRSALIKSLLNFLKRAVVDSSYINHSRRSKFLAHNFITFPVFSHGWRFAQSAAAHFRDKPVLRFIVGTLR